MFNIKIALSIFSVAVAICLSGCAEPRGGTRQPAYDIGGKFLSSLQARNFQAAHACLSSQGKIALSPAQLQSEWDKLEKSNGAFQEAKLHFDDAQVVKDETGGKHVLLSYDLIFANGQTPMRLTCVPQPSKWVYSIAADIAANKANTPNNLNWNAWSNWAAARDSSPSYAEQSAASASRAQSMYRYLYGQDNNPLLNPFKSWK